MIFHQIGNMIALLFIFQKEHNKDWDKSIQRSAV